MQTGTLAEEMREKLPIVQYWHASEPPGEIHELLESFRRLNPRRPHLLFDAGNATEFISQHFGRRELAAFQACGPPAMQADYFRFCALLQLGGIWVDAGFVCVREMSPLLEDPYEGRLFRSFSKVSEDLLANGLMSFTRPGHPFMKLAVEIATGLIERRWRGKVIAITGPLVISAINRLYEAGSMDAFIRQMTELQSGLEEGLRLPQYGRLVCELVGDYRRVAPACKRLRVFPAQAREKWVRSPDKSLAHRDGGRHWSHRGSDVYAKAMHRGAEW